MPKHLAFDFGFEVQQQRQTQGPSPASLRVLAQDDRHDVRSIERCTIPNYLELE
jgi:hypothetical protein